MRIFLIMTALFLLTALPATAQENDSNALSYTTLGARKERTGGHMNYKVMNYDETKLKPLDPNPDMDSDGKDKDAKPPEDEAEAAKAWDKYKALAAGQYQAEGKKPEDTEDAPEKVDPSGGDEAPPTGIAGILEEYRKNKNQRSQMRTIHVSQPDDAKTEDKTDDTDKTEKPPG